MVHSVLLYYVKHTGGYLQIYNILYLCIIQQHVDYDKEGIKNLYFKIKSVLLLKQFQYVLRNNCCLMMFRSVLQYISSL